MGPALPALRARLSSIGFDDALASNTIPDLHGPELQSVSSRHDEPLRTALDLLVYGAAVPQAAARDALTDTGFDALDELGLLAAEAGGTVLLPDLRLVHHHGVLVFCDRPIGQQARYYGPDSRYFGRFLLPARGSVLDVCAGVGTQGILCALTAEHVVCTERESAPAALVPVNADLNDVRARVEVRIGSLLDPVLAGERFDRVICNPPHLPVPEGLSFPVVAAGGEDGLAVTTVLVAALPDVLTHAGRAQVLGGVLGDASGPRTDTLDASARANGIDMTLLVTGFEYIGPGSYLFEAMVAMAVSAGNERAAARRALRLHLRRGGSDRSWTYLLSARRANHRSDAGLRTRRTFSTQ
jgi:hypothetical protein